MVMKKFAILLLFIILNFSIPCYSEDITPTIKQDEKKEAIIAKDEEFQLLPDTKQSFIEKVEKNISLFSENLKERFSIWLSRSTKYIEKMKEILTEKGLPEDLVYIPLIESGFNVNARSRAKAVGPWQFIESTAKRYGLIIDWWRDERKDPIKSTVAAAEYLKYLYKMFGDWSLALAAYNAGEGRVYRAVNRFGENDYWNLLNTTYLPNETKNYVPKYIAAITIAKQPENYGFDSIKKHESMSYAEINIPSPTDLAVIAKCAQVDVTIIKELNPELKRWSTPMNVQNYTIRIPEEKKDIFMSNFEQIPSKKRFSHDTYIVKKGDTVYKIAKKTGLSTTVLYEMNETEIFKQLKPGTQIMIPPHDKFTPSNEDKFYEKKSVKKTKVAKKKSSSTKNRKKIRR